MLQDKLLKNKDQGTFIKTQIFKYLRYWYWFVGSIVIAVIYAKLKTHYSPRIYSSVAKINALDKEDGLDLSNSMYLLKRNNVVLEKEIEILKSYPILKKVVQNQDLTLRFFQEGDLRDSEINNLPFDLIKTIDSDSIYGNFGYTIDLTEEGFEVSKIDSDEESIIFPQYTSMGVEHNLPFELNPLVKDIPPSLIGNEYMVYFAPVKSVIMGLKGSIKINPLVENASIIELSYQSESIAKNERIINELINVFNQDGIDDRRKISLSTYEFIDERFKTLSKELDSLETDIKEFKQENKIITIESKAEAGMTDLTSTQESLFELENQLLLLDILEQSLRSKSSEPELLPANMGVSNGSVNNLVNEYNNLVLEYQSLAVSASAENPGLIVLDNKLNTLNKNIFASITGLKQQLTATKEQLEKKNEQLIDEVYNIPASEKAFLDIKRQQEIKQELYLYLLQKREEAAINYAITEPSVKVIEYALSTGAPVSPNANQNLMVALIFGIGIPFGAIYLIFLLDTKVKNKSTIEEIDSKYPVVGELPKVDQEFRLSFTKTNDTSEQAEAYRVLCYNLGVGLTSKKPKKGQVVFTTSTIKGEGKTHVSMNLTLALSSMSKKVLLIGADLRNPQVHNFIERQKNEIGLSNYLYDEALDWRTALIKNFEQHPHLAILLSGDIPPNPTTLLTNGRFETLLEEAKQEYDYVIVDTAPTLLVSDTLLIASLADITMYVTKSNFTEKKLIDYPNELAELGKINNLVYVVNAIDFKKANGYGYGYGYKYGYRYGYGKDKEK
jgi:capsular exopolysaccharide synthesis family protein